MARRWLHCASLFAVQMSVPMVRISLQLYPQHAEYTDIRRAAAEAESLGVDVLYTWDHFYPLSGDADGRHFECWTLLAALAEATQRVAIGPMVACNSYRNPDLLADMARTVDHISGGRLVFGVGAGWFERDYEEYGYAFGTANSRLADFESALPRFKHRFENLNPGPLGKMRFLIGGGGEKVTLRLTAEYADIWHGFARAEGTRTEVEQVVHKCKVLDRWCEKIGRDPRSIERSIGVAADRLDLADAIHAAGANEIMVGADGPDYDLGPLKEWLAWRDSTNKRLA